MRWLPIAIAAAVVVTLATLIATNVGGGGPHHASGALPTAGHGAPVDYRIVYDVTTPSGTTSEEHVVHRPFDSETILRDATGAVTLRRWSSLGTITSSAPGGATTRFDTAIAPADGDSRPDQLDAGLVSAQRLTAAGTAQVGGRSCTERSEQTKVAMASGPTSSDGTLPVVLTTCVDRQGLVLEQRYVALANHTTVLTKRAVELEVGSGVPAIHPPNVAALPVDQGGGSVRKVAVDARIPFEDVFHLATPKGFTFVGRYSVVPVRLSSSGAPAPGTPGIALYTDVWRRGPDVLLLDQGAEDTGAAPFDPSTKVGTVTVPGVGAADLALDDHLAEVRFTRAAGGFARVAGTLPLDQLVRLADSLTVQTRPAATAGH